MLFSLPCLLGYELRGFIVLSVHLSCLAKCRGGERKGCLETIGCMVYKSPSASARDACEAVKALNKNLLSITMVTAFIIMAALGASVNSSFEMYI